MQVYVINLAKRQDRLKYVTSELDRVGVDFIRVNAVDGSDSMELASFKDRRPSKSGSMISDGAAACSLSHMRAWQEFLQSENSHCVILEDDVVLSDDFATCLSADWLPDGADIVRLETFNTRVHLAHRPNGALGGRKVYRMLTRHVGTAAYLISRAAAESLLDYMAPLSDPIDEVMFNEGYGWMPQAFVHQLSPAMAIQANRMDEPEMQNKSFAAGSIIMRSIEGDTILHETLRSRVSRRLKNELLARKLGTDYCLVPFKK